MDKVENHVGIGRQKVLLAEFAVSIFRGRHGDTPAGNLDQFAQVSARGRGLNLIRPELLNLLRNLVRSKTRRWVGQPGQQFRTKHLRQPSLRREVIEPRLLIENVERHREIVLSK